MANRTYLFATDLVPSIANSGAPRKLVGLSECNYEIPLTYALLVAGSPELCLSNIWQYRTEAGAPSHPLALAAPYAQGLQRARDFYALLTQPTARSVFHEALSFLEREENQQPYLLLELGEYLSMFDEEDPPEGKLHMSRLGRSTPCCKATPQTASGKSRVSSMRCPPTIPSQPGRRRWSNSVPASGAMFCITRPATEASRLLRSFSTVSRIDSLPHP